MLTFIIGKILTAVALKAATKVEARILSKEIVKEGVTSVVAVPVKSPWTSKINWVAVPAAVAGIAAVFGFDLSKETVEYIVTAASGLFALIAVIRTWFTKDVVSTSAPKV